ncbi:MAG: hypothetical protein CMH57_14840 [Myxococcales bacterium]|nr:hypothetical protein [Myxococcales bacterium]
MSTRGWYEFYVIDEERDTVELALQFYKWGDATWNNAHVEHNRFKALTRKFNSTLPLQPVEDFFTDQLGDRASSLSQAFMLSYTFFLLLRADSILDNPFLTWRARTKPLEDQADYQLGYQVGLAAALQGQTIPRHKIRVLERALFSLAVGRYIRRWSEWQERLPFLDWLQYITMITDDSEMGHILSSRILAWDISYRYRFFFHVPTLTPHQQRIQRIGVQFCSSNGSNLLEREAEELKRMAETRDDPYDDELQKRHQELAATIQALGVEYERLDDVLAGRQLKTFEPGIERVLKKAPPPSALEQLLHDKHHEGFRPGLEAGTRYAVQKLVCQQRLKRPITEAERDALTQRSQTLSTEELLTALLDRTPEELAVWLNSPAEALQ